MAARRRLLGLVLAAAALVLGVLAYRRMHAPTPPLPATRRPAAAAPWNPARDAGLPSGYREALSCEGDTPPGDAADADRHEEAAAQVLRTIARDLAASPAVADRALALYLQWIQAQNDAHAQFARQNPQCAADDSCGPREDAAVQGAARPYRDALARLAAASNDAEVYDRAYHACEYGDAAPDRGECAQLSALQWTRIEPDNALAWLFAAAEAKSQGQPALVDDAMFHASRARQIDSHWNAFARILDARALRNETADVRQDVTLGAFGMAAATRFAPLGPVSAYCGATPLADPNRRQVCDDLAHVLAEHSDTSVGLQVAAKLGEGLGWPRHQLDALHDRVDAYYEIAWNRSAAEPKDCATVRARRQLMDGMLRFGEIGAIKRAMAASGQSEAALAQRLRASVPSRLQERAAGAGSTTASPPVAPVR